MREGPDGALTKQVPVMSIQVTSSNRGSRQRLVQPLCIAIGILVVVAGITGLLFPAISTNQGTNEPQELRPISDTEASFGLINPHNGDNGTDPARTTTIECTQDLTLPVLAGVDVVSYFDDLHEGDPPIFGAESLMSVYNGYRFYFSTWENLLKFEKDPDKYLPAWGGFCSYGIANEHVWTKDTLGPFVNPTKWRILSDGRLHLFRSQVPMEKFGADIEGNIARGYNTWLHWFGIEHGPLNTACFCQTWVCADQ